MAAHSSFLAWEIPWTEEPDRLQSMGLQKIHDLATKQRQFILFYFPFIFISWRLISLQDCSGFCHTLT